MEKKSRYSDLRKMTKKDLEDELNFYTFLDELIGISISDAHKIRNKMWLDSLWIEIKRRGYTWSKVYKLRDKNDEN